MHVHIPVPSKTNVECDGSAQALPFDVDDDYYENLFVTPLSEPLNCNSRILVFCSSENEWSENDITTIAVRDYFNPVSKTRPNHGDTS